MKFIFHLPYLIAEENSLSEIPPDLCRNQKKLKAQDSAVTALLTLCHSAEQAGVIIVVISSYRDLNVQKKFFEDAEKRHGRGRGILWVAPPGYSEHHTGFVFDLADRNCPETDDEPSFETTPAWHWLFENAERFGFELSFPRNNWQGIGYEPWHWRYVGDKTSKQWFHPGVWRGTFKWRCAIWQALRSVVKEWIESRRDEIRHAKQNH